MAAAEAGTAEPTRKRASLSYNPAIDGIRGLAIGAVLLFHNGFDWARGGYLGVSTFFTLSGFLITSLLLAEHRNHGRIDLAAFWSRRVRRLLPASTVTLGALVLSMVLTNELWERSLPGDVVSAVLQVANWRFLFEDREYAQLFASPSPVLHFWSLAIEEQFYWVFPLLAAGVLAIGRGSIRVFGSVLAGLLGLSAVLTLVFSDSPNTVYFATPIRMGEILVGALLAVAVGGGAVRRIEGSPQLRGALGGLGVLAMVASAWAWWNLEQNSRIVSRGGLLLYALVSGALVASVCVAGPWRRLLAFEPLRLLGLISYGVYLIHWPLFLILDHERLSALLEDFGPRTQLYLLFGIRMAVVLPLAVVSYRWIESPVRRGWRPSLAAPQVIALGGVAAVLLGAVVVPKLSPPPRDPFADYIAAVEGPDPATLPPDAKIGVVVGDSTVMRTAWGLTAWGRDAGNVLVLQGGSAEQGCSIGDEGDVEYRGVKDSLRGDACAQWRERLLDGIAKDKERYGRVDFAVVQTGLWDVANRRIPGVDGWVHIGDPAYDAYLRKEMRDVVDVLAGEGVTTVWLTSPLSDWRLVDPPLAEEPPEFDPARTEAYNAMIRELDAERDDVVAVDLAGYAASLPPEQLADLREDGIHWTLDGARLIADWLGPEVLASVKQ